MAMVKDPVCGMMLESTEAAGTYAYKGVTYYFCSRDEIDAFAKNPERYLEREVSLQSKDPNDVPLERHEPTFTKKGGIPSGKFGSAGSGGAEFDRGPERHDR